MNTTKILESEIASLKVASLPTRPTAPSALGGKGYTASDMKAAFDRLPLFIIERLNSLIEDISEVGSGSLAGAMPTGILEGQTLNDLFRDIETGDFASYLCVFDKTLNAQIEELIDELNAIKNERYEGYTVRGLDRGRVTETSPLGTGIRHLRGNEQEWRECDLVVPEGELALSYQRDGNVLIKLGDGEHPFSELDPIGCKARFSNTPTLILTHGTHTRYQTAKSLEVFLPGTYGEDYYSILSFDSGTSATAITYPDHISFGGDDVTDGVFSPVPKRHYTVTFYQGGRMCALVHATPLASSMIGLKYAEGLCSVGVNLPSRESISDVQIYGVSGYVNGTYCALGEYDKERGDYYLKLRTHNCNLMSYENFVELFQKAYKSSRGITFTVDEEEISYQTTSTPASIFIGADRALPMGTGIRFRFRMKPDCSPTNKIFNTGLCITYNDGEHEYITSKEAYTSEQDGVLIDFVTRDQVLYIDVVHVDGTKRTILKDGFSIFADGVGDYTTEPDIREYEIRFSEPLRSCNEAYDTLSIDDGTITRQFVELPIKSLAEKTIRLESLDGIPIFSAELDEKGLSYGESTCNKFTYYESREEISEYEYSYCIDGGTIYFTLSASITDAASAAEHLATRKEILLYTREVTRIDTFETVEINTHLPFTAFEVGSILLPIVAVYYFG